MRNYPLIPLLILFAATAMAQVPVERDETTINPIVENPLQVEITEWPVPWKDTRPRDPDVAPNGVIWLVGQGGDYAARFDPSSGEFRRKDLPPGTGPHNLIIDWDGTVWIAGNRQAFIGRMNYTTGEVTRFTMPDETARDPHTMVFSGKDEIWFTMQWGNKVGRLNKKSGQVDLYQCKPNKPGHTVSRWIRKAIHGLRCWAPTVWPPLTLPAWN